MSSPKTLQGFGKRTRSAVSPSCRVLMFVAEYPGQASRTLGSTWIAETEAAAAVKNRTAVLLRMFLRTGVKPRRTVGAWELWKEASAFYDNVKHSGVFASEFLPFPCWFVAWHTWSNLAVRRWCDFWWKLETSWRADQLGRLIEEVKEKERQIQIPVHTGNNFDGGTCDQFDIVLLFYFLPTSYKSTSTSSNNDMLASSLMTPTCRRTKSSPPWPSIHHRIVNQVEHARF